MLIGLQSLSRTLLLVVSLCIVLSAQQGQLNPALQQATVTYERVRVELLTFICVCVPVSFKI
jgi:hypothetical protein